jgi:predicted acetyltransferase
MEPEIRPARADEMESFGHVVRTGFGMQADFKLDLDPAWTLCAFAEGKLATAYAAWPLTMYFSGASLPVAGITMVGTFPAYRRKNFLRKVTETHFRRLHEQGEQSITALHASMAAIYQRYGYAVVSTRNMYSIEPRYLRFSSQSPVSGGFYEAGDQDIKLMADLYQRFASKRVGYLRRGEDMQTARGSPFNVLLSMPPALPPIKLIYQEKGEPLGYVIYSSIRDTVPGSPMMGQRIAIHDLVWLSASAYQAAWDLMADMDLANRIDWSKAPLDDPLPHLLLEPRKLNLTSSDDLLARIIDVERALPQRPYNGEGALTFEIVDDLCAWNRGKWRLEVSASGNEIRRTEEGPQLVMPVSTLAMLMFGQISASLAARMGRLEVNDSQALSLWDNIMRTAYRPVCADNF